MTELPLDHNQPTFSVSEISQAVKRTVESSFDLVRIRGEISGYKQAPSGHVYLSLKDDNSVLAAVCWRGTAQQFSFAPEDGLEVICTGRITTYAGQSKYQLIVDAMEPAGTGALMALLEKRKTQLQKEGLFDASRKKNLPFFPQTIGIITSPTGAVIQDILHRLEDRFPCHVKLWPVLVQGDQAASQITAAIEGFNAMSEKPDILIVARGGGSIEDLWPFNEENVVRAAAASTIPLISAVGHETDTTLIDFASDRRAPTPTAAAEMATPVRTELLAGLQNIQERLYLSITRYVSHQQQQVEGLARGIPSLSQLLGQITQRLDHISIQLHKAMPTMLQRKSQMLEASAARLRHPSQLIAQATEQLKRIDLLRIINRQLTSLEETLDFRSRLLESYNYTSILKRGFALVRNDKDQLVSSAGSIKSNAVLSLEFADGKHTVIAASKPKQQAKQSNKSNKQGSLF